MKIFWSWQSDNHEKSGRYFISEVLGAVTRELNNLPIDEAMRGDDVGPIEVDHDTKGVAGTPPIADTILQKIRDAAVFVADVTPVGHTDNGKRLANPNVMIELGYAIHALGHNRIILVMNKAEHGALDTLPFDLRYLRGPAMYELGPLTPPDAKQQQKKQLTSMLLGRIKPALEHALRVQRESKRLTSPKPEFSLSLTSAGKPLPETISQSLPDSKRTTLDEVMASVPKLVAPEIDPPQRPRSSRGLLTMGIFPKITTPVSEWTREEVISYNRRVDVYYGNYKQYLSDLEDQLRLRLRTLRVELHVANNGTLPATNIDVELDIPDGLSLFEIKYLPQPPEAPRPPALDPDPISIGQAVHPPIDFSGVPSPHHWTRVDVEDRHVRFHLANLKHGYGTTSDTFAIAFTTAEEIGIKELPFSISANECPEPIVGTVFVQVRLADD
ncbi:MAG: hypothetical protein CFE44_04850 [Burkholderiales bacterium PBB4]|nr:MAG: hypothetical protein CFE44_04850 [Burkholderiales bacterium PBB4]